jgi:putative ubiquitin-RnfH superfamily antitoxin RatB of RatAB toxin-antitoxin module
MAIEVEVVYALPGREDAVKLRVPEGTTLLEAVQASGMLERHLELKDHALKLGVYGHVKPPRSPAQPGDRIEIYRALTIDPKEARRRRARRKRV